MKKLGVRAFALTGGLTGEADPDSEVAEQQPPYARNASAIFFQLA